MAETKKPANTTKKASAKDAPVHVPTAAEKSKATGLRIGAVILWLVAIGAEVMALLTVIKKVFPGLSPTWRIIIMIAFLVLDLAALIVGSALWKKSNKLDPASEKNKVKFWLWNNLGVIVAAFAFIPFIIIVLLNKDTDKKTKAIATVVAIIALLIGGISSYDFNPVSAENLQAAIDNIKGEVYATPSGTVYHIKYTVKDDNGDPKKDENGNIIEKYCYHISKSTDDADKKGTELKDNVITFENVEKAIKEGGYTRLCKTCAEKNDLTEIDNLLIQGNDTEAATTTTTEG